MAALHLTTMSDSANLLEANIFAQRHQLITQKRQRPIWPVSPCSNASKNAAGRAQITPAARAFVRDRLKKAGPEDL